MKTRETAQVNVCINNMRMIDAGKEQLALEKNIGVGGVLDEEGVNKYIYGETRPSCPAGGDYTYNPYGKPPECSVHGDLGDLYDY